MGDARRFCEEVGLILVCFQSSKYYFVHYQPVDPIDMKLHGYFRSSASYRVRIALNLKNIACTNEFVHLTRGEQQSDEFQLLNPQKFVPVLEDDGIILTQSLAIIEYLDEKYPHPALLPKSEEDRAFVRSIALSVACDIHPLNNLRVLNYLEYNLNLDKSLRKQWYCHWIATEFKALETRFASSARYGKFSFGDSPTIADVCLVPQMANARRFNCPLRDYPILVEIDQNCRKLEAFQKASPENQPDAE